MKTVPMWRRYARLIRPDPKADVEDELQFHIDSKVEDLIAAGWRPEAARKEAQRQMGDLIRVRQVGEEMGQIRERSRRHRDYWGEFVQDLRYSLRTLWGDRAFTILTTLILALGIGANTAVFSVVDTLWLRPLPFAHPEQLTWLSSGRSLSAEVHKSAGLSAVTYMVGVVEEIQRRNHSFQTLTSYNPFLGNSEYTLTGSGEAQPVAGVMVAQNFFETLGVQPILGRLFLDAECSKGGRQAVLLSYGFWQRQFAGDPSIVGKPITLSKEPYTVVGVMPQSFDFGSVFSPGMNFDVFVPAVMDVLRYWGNTLAVVGRLKPGVSAAQAQAELDVLIPQIQAAHKEWHGDWTTNVTGLKDFVSGKLRRSLIVLWCAVGLILLIVWVNLSNLMVSRAAGRAKEFAMRCALGAGRGRLFRQLMTESLVLCCASALAGLGLAFALTFWAARQGSIALPLLNSIRVDGAALGWTLLITAATTLLFGLVPGLRLSAGNIQEALKNSSQGMSAGRRHERLRGILVISEVALACVLLISAGLLLRSFMAVLDVDLGFQPDQASVIKIDYDDGDSNKRRGVILHEMLRNILAIPGVEQAGIADMLPLGRNRTWGFKAKGREYTSDAQLGALVRIVTPGYLGAMGMRLKSGRDFSWADASNTEPVVIINEAAARRHWPGEDPTGRMGLTTGPRGWQDTRVIGVISDVRELSLESSADPEMYLPTWQAAPEGAELVVRSKVPIEALSGMVMRTLRSLNPNQPVAQLRPLKRVVDQSVSPRRFFALLVTSFAALGLLLASLGIFGVISYSVGLRTQEIGIRMALGASPSQVEWPVVARSLRLALTGAAIGTVTSFAAARWIASMLFGTRPTDPATFLGIVVVLSLVALVAGYIPARRAARIQPVIALRAE